MLDQQDLGSEHPPDHPTQHPPDQTVTENELREELLAQTDDAKVGRRANYFLSGRWH